jgi:hypothetical protein
MGYYVTLEESHFFLPIENYEKAYQAMCLLNKTHDHLKHGGSWSGGKQTEKWFSWMPSNYPEILPDAISILESLGFQVAHDERGINHLYYDSKTGQQELFLEAIAPYVETGSYLVWRGEDGDRWATKFADGQISAHGVVTTILW